MRLYAIFTLVFFWGEIYCQQLPVSLIDDSLTDKANVVIRNSVLNFDVINRGNAIETYHVELTILNEKGKREAFQYVHYNSLKNIISFHGEIYDKLGNRVKKIKNSFVEDVSASGSNLYTDDRFKVLDFSYPSYPYSIVFEYKVERDGLMFYPNWMPQDHSKTAIEKATFTVTVPESLGLNFFESNVKGTGRKEGEKEVYVWEIKNVPGFIPEPYSPPFREQVPFVLLTPKQFEMAGYKGSMTSWNSIGLYENELLKTRDELPEEAIKDIENAVAGLTDKREIAKRVYEYVQNTTRYVSVQLGIGGWQPYDATYVYENGYGDCKALSNYTHALLKQVGVPSIYTNVFAGSGEPDIITDFPNSRFNHVIVAVPFEKDTVWLECTSQKKPFGYTGAFTSGRHVLLITEEGGKLAKTPTFTKEENTQYRTIDVELTKSGTAIASIRTEYSGLQYENVNNQLYRDKEEQKKWLFNKVDFNKTSILDFSYDHEPGIVPKITEKINVSSKGFGAITGNRIFFEVNPLNQLSSIPKKLKERKTDIYINTAYTDIDSIHFIVPEGYHVEYLPDSMHIKNQFGEYQTEYKQTKDGLIYVRKMVREKGKFPASSYEEFRNMLKEVSKSDRAKVVLVGST